MVNLLRVLLIITSVSSYSQFENNDSYKKFQKVDLTNDKIVFLDNGILPNEYTVFHTKSEASFVTKYKFLVFGIKNNFSNYKSPLKAKFWVTPIRVFVDDQIDKKVRLEISNFIKTFPKIRNLQIELVSTKEKSNYYINTNDSKRYVKIDNNNEYQSQEFFNGINFEMISDGNGNFYSGSLFYNTEQIINKEIQIKKLKQFFISSLGTFIISTFIGKESLFSEQYENKSVISDFDLKILQYHYDYLNRNEINNIIFDKIQTQLNNLPENNTYKIKI